LKRLYHAVLSRSYCDNMYRNWGMLSQTVVFIKSIFVPTQKGWKRSWDFL